MRTVLVLLLLLTLCLGSLAIAQKNVIDPNAAPAYVPQRAIAEINVRDLSPGKVIGVLGKPLGSRTTIDGVRAEGIMLPSPFAVSGLDGRAVKGPFYVEIRGAVLQKATQYRLEGYESGEFAGPPAWSAPGAQQFLQYRSFFVVTKIDVSKAVLTTPKSAYLSFRDAVLRRDWHAAESCLASELRERLKDAITDRTFFDEYVSSGFRYKTTGRIPACRPTERGIADLEAFDKGSTMPGPEPRRFSAVVASGGGPSPWMAMCYFIEEKDGWKLTTERRITNEEFRAWHDSAIPKESQGSAKNLEGKPVEQAVPPGG